jgi:hypothetical protein
MSLREGWSVKVKVRCPTAAGCMNGGAIDGVIEDTSGAALGSRTRDVIPSELGS